MAFNDLQGLAKYMGQFVYMSKLPKPQECSRVGWDNTHRDGQLQILELMWVCLAEGYDIKTIYAYVGGTNSHVDGYTCDYMTPNDACGYFIYKYVWENRNRMPLWYCVWRDRIRSTTPGNGGEAGKPFTKDKSHFWHVHNSNKKGYKFPIYVAGEGSVVIPPPPPKDKYLGPYWVDPKKTIYPDRLNGRDNETGEVVKKRDPGYRLDTVVEIVTVNGTKWALTSAGYRYDLNKLTDVDPQYVVPAKPAPPTYFELVPNGKVTTNFAVKGDWAWGKHTGIDINVVGEDDYGRPARTVKPCKVVDTGNVWGSSYGQNQVVVEYEVEPGEKYPRRGLYAHMSAIAAGVVKGAKLPAGHDIGRLGYSGNVRPKGKSGTHLHYEERAYPYRYTTINGKVVCDAVEPKLPSK